MQDVRLLWQLKRAAVALVVHSQRAHAKRLARLELWLLVVSEGWTRAHRLIGTDRRADLQEKLLLSWGDRTKIKLRCVILRHYRVYLVQSHDRINSKVVGHKAANRFELIIFVFTVFIITAAQLFFINLFAIVAILWHLLKRLGSC